MFTFNLKNGESVTGKITYFDYDDHDLVYEIVVSFSIAGKEFNVELNENDLEYGTLVEYFDFIGFNEHDMICKPVNIGNEITKQRVNDKIALLEPFVNVDDYEIRYQPFPGSMYMTCKVSHRKDNNFQKWLES